VGSPQPAWSPQGTAPGLPCGHPHPAGPCHLDHPPASVEEWAGVSCRGDRLPSITSPACAHLTR